MAALFDFFTRCQWPAAVEAALSAAPDDATRTLWEKACSDARHIAVKALRRLEAEGHSAAAVPLLQASVSPLETAGMPEQCLPQALLRLVTTRLELVAHNDKQVASDGGPLPLAATAAVERIAGVPDATALLVAEARVLSALSRMALQRYVEAAADAEAAKEALAGFDPGSQPDVIHCYAIGNLQLDSSILQLA